MPRGSSSNHSNASAASRSNNPQVPEPAAPKSWLPEAPPAPDTTNWTTWMPNGLAKHLSADELKEMSYVCLEEPYENIVRVMVSPWPMLDEEGRLSFPRSENDHTFYAYIDELDQFIYGKREILNEEEYSQETVDALKSRRINEGDVFAIKIDKEALSEEVQADFITPSKLFTGPAYDTTGPARTEAYNASIG